MLLLHQRPNVVDRRGVAPRRLSSCKDDPGPYARSPNWSLRMELNHRAPGFNRPLYLLSYREMVLLTGFAPVFSA